MLGNELKSKNLKSTNLMMQSTQSVMPDQMDEKRLLTLIDEKDKIIRKLTKKVEKYEEAFKKSNIERGVKNKKTEEPSNDNIHLQLLRDEIQKTKHLEDIIEEITERVNIILQDLSHENTITDNTQEIRIMLQELDTSRCTNNNSGYFQSQHQNTMNISSEWVKKFDILEGVFKSFKIKSTSLREVNSYLTNQNQQLRSKVNELKITDKYGEEIKHLQMELKQQKKQKQKIKKLLEKVQLEKNQIYTRIHNAAKDAEVKAKTKEELVQYSKELQFRVKDLEKQKDSMLKEASKGKQDQIKKYSDFLMKLKVIKEKSVMGKSCM